MLFLSTLHRVSQITPKSHDKAAHLPNHRTFNELHGSPIELNIGSKLTKMGIPSKNLIGEIMDTLTLQHDHNKGMK